MADSNAFIAAAVISIHFLPVLLVAYSCPRLNAFPGRLAYLDSLGSNFSFTCLTPTTVLPINAPSLITPDIPPLVKVPKVETLLPTGINFANALNSIAFSYSDNSPRLALKCTE